MFKRILVGLLIIFIAKNVSAQTETDALFMGEKNICGGLIYGKSSWSRYWEGAFYRKNENLGSIKSRSVMAMANYGIKDDLNIIASASWVNNFATAGTLIEQKGVQDLNLFVKKELFSKNIEGFNSSLVVVGGVSFPLTNYVADYLPLSIGMRSKTASLRLLGDAQKEHWYGTFSAAWMLRGSVTIDRTSYYTTELIYSNKVAMPSLFLYNIRAGWRDGADKYFELVLDRMNTIGGFDMRKNDMPFLSNNMEFLRLGFSIKYPIPRASDFSVMASGMQTLSGRNMGKTFLVSAGLVYQFEL